MVHLNIKDADLENQNYQSRLLNTYLEALHNPPKSDAELDKIFELASPMREDAFVKWALGNSNTKTKEEATAPDIIQSSASS